MNRVRVSVLVLLIGVASVLIFISLNKPSVFPVLTQPDFLESYFKNKSGYDESFAKFTNIVKKKPLAAITSHHFLAKDLIAQTFAGINPGNIKRVVVVGPDHYDQLTGTKYLAQITDTTWRTPFGNMNADNEIVTAISQDSRVYSDINAFRTEHSVYLLVPFARKSFPEAKIIPLILGQKAAYPDYYKLGKEVSDLVNFGETVVVISSDFSHNASIAKAKLNDEKSIELLKKMRLEDINFIENDCRECLAFLYGYLDGKNPDFELIFNNNSFAISGESPENVTSYIGAYFIGK